MPRQTYISTDSATLFVGGFWLDDAKGIEFQIQDPKQPLYGYRSALFDDVARGQTLVHGMLDINFRYKGYLTLVLGRMKELEARAGRIGQNKLEQAGPEGQLGMELANLQNANELRTAAIDPRQITPDSYAALLASPHREFNIRGFTRLATAMREEFWDLSNQEVLNEFDDALSRRPRPGTYNNPIDLKIVYKRTDPSDLRASEDPALTHTLKGVRFVSQSQVLTNNVPGGGEPIIERYQFIAREIV